MLCDFVSDVYWFMKFWGLFLGLKFCISDVVYYFWWWILSKISDEIFVIFEFLNVNVGELVVFEYLD